MKEKSHAEVWTKFFHNGLNMNIYRVKIYIRAASGSGVIQMQEDCMASSRRKIESLLSCAGIEIGGSRPWDIQVHNDNFYTRVLAKGSLGLGESYMDAWWDCERLDELFNRILKSDISKRVRTWTNFADHVKALVINTQKGERAYQVGERHYDIGNDLYRTMLDRRMIYSCGYWPDASTLDEAQEAKLDLICRKLGLKEGMSVLDIGCGWGGAARFAAEHYGVKVTGITISREQLATAKDMCRGLPAEFQLMDYRLLNEKFDRIFSIGMFEHVGHKNYTEYFDVAKRCLKSGGLFLLHTIGQNTSSRSGDPWITRYIFPNSVLPSASDITSAVEGRFVIEDWHSFGPDYDTTLMQWYRNFTGSWESLRGRYSESFYRMWKYYLLCCAGTFRARSNQVWQLVLSPDGLAGGYQAVR